MDVSSWVTIIMVLIFLIYIAILGWYIYKRINKDLDTYREALADAAQFSSDTSPPENGKDGLDGLNAYELYLIDILTSNSVLFQNLQDYMTANPGSNVSIDYRGYLVDILTTNMLNFLNYNDFLAAYDAPDGDQGDPAPPAIDGSRGEDGSVGAVGPAGLDGTIGPSGVKGEKGEIGDTFISFIPNNEIIEETTRTGINAIVNSAFYAENMGTGYETAPENYPSCEFIKYYNIINNPEDNRPAANNDKASIRYYFNGKLLCDLVITWTVETSPGTYTDIYISYIIYKSQPFEIIGITSPVTITSINKSSPSVQTTIHNFYTDKLKFRTILSENKGLTESSFTTNIIEENLQNKSFTLQRIPPTDPFVRKIYDTVSTTTGLNEKFNIEQKCKIREVIEVNPSANQTINSML